MEGKKVSPKFRTEFISDGIPDDPRIEELKNWCLEFEKCGLMPAYDGGSFGNLSFRTKENEFIITASGIKHPSSVESFVRVSSVDENKMIVLAHGRKQPSSESILHYMIYREKKDINAIFHGHCEDILKAAAELGLPTTSSEEAYGTVELAKSVLDVLNGHKFVIMKGHGFISLGKNMDEAGKLALKHLS